jgi:hypothetical protein
MTTRGKPGSPSLSPSLSLSLSPSPSLSPAGARQPATNALALPNATRAPRDSVRRRPDSSFQPPVSILEAPEPIRHRLDSMLERPNSILERPEPTATGNTLRASTATPGARKLGPSPAKWERLGEGPEARAARRPDRSVAFSGMLWLRTRQAAQGRALELGVQADARGAGTQTGKGCPGLFVRSSTETFGVL